MNEGVTFHIILDNKFIFLSIPALMSSFNFFNTCKNESNLPCNFNSFCVNYIYIIISESPFFPTN